MSLALTGIALMMSNGLESGSATEICLGEKSGQGASCFPAVLLKLHKLIIKSHTHTPQVAESIPGRGNSMCEGPLVGNSFGGTVVGCIVIPKGYVHILTPGTYVCDLKTLWADIMQLKI